jgi:peroxiredoxin
MTRILLSVTVLGALVAACGSDKGSSQTVYYIEDAGAADTTPAPQDAATQDKGTTVAPDTLGTPETPPDNPNDPWAKVGPAFCPTGQKTGNKVGTMLPEMEFRDCDDNIVKFSDFCGSNALWIVLGAGWCSYCNAEAGTFDDIYTKHQELGVSALYIVVQDWNGYPATAKFCKEWKDMYGLSMPVVYDAKNKVGYLVQENAFPLNLIADERNIITWLAYGFVDPYSSEVELLKELKHVPK